MGGDIERAIYTKKVLDAKHLTLLMKNPDNLDSRDTRYQERVLEFLDSWGVDYEWIEDHKI